MINVDVIITALIGIVTSFTSGFLSWFFTRKKYNSEVDSNIIANMDHSLEFYKQLSDDNKRRLDDTINRSNSLEIEVRDLRQQLIKLSVMVCTDLSCQLRKKDLEIKELKNEKAQ